MRSENHVIQVSIWQVPLNGSVAWFARTPCTWYLSSPTADKNAKLCFLIMVSPHLVRHLSSFRLLRCLHQVSNLGGLKLSRVFHYQLPFHGSVFMDCSHLVRPLNNSSICWFSWPVDSSVKNLSFPLLLSILAGTLQGLHHGLSFPDQLFTM